MTTPHDPERRIAEIKDRLRQSGSSDEFWSQAQGCTPPDGGMEERARVVAEHAVAAWTGDETLADVFTKTIADEVRRRDQEILASIKVNRGEGTYDHPACIVRSSLFPGWGYTINFDDLETQVKAAEQRAEAAEKRVGELVTAVEKVLDTLDQIVSHPSYQMVFAVAHTHGAKYAGPALSTELVKMRQMLTKPTPERATERGICQHTFIGRPSVCSKCGAPANPTTPNTSKKETP